MATMPRAPWTRMAIAASAALIAAGCGEAGDPEPVAQPPDVEPTSAAPTTPEPEAADLDVRPDLATANADAAWLSSVTTATEDETGRITVETTIVDPRGDNGSPAAEEALEICEVVVDLAQADSPDGPLVAIMEADGTHFVLHGHPSYPNGCTDV